VDVYTHRTGRRHHICAVRSRESRAAAFPPLSCPDPCERSGRFSAVAYFSQPSYRSPLISSGMTSMIRVRVRRQRCTGPAQWGQRFRRCSSRRSIFAGGGRRVPGCPFLAPGRYRRLGAAGFSYTGIMPEGVLPLGTKGLASAFKSAMRLAKIVPHNFTRKKQP